MAYTASTHETKTTTPARMVFGKELCLHCNLLFGVTSHKKQPTTDYVADLTDVGKNLKVASDMMKAHYDRLPWIP